MKLNQFTDIGIRTLAYLAHLSSGHPSTITTISKDLNISRNHLTKVVHFMGKQGWIITTQGKNGGIRLAHTSQSYRIGNIIQTLEKSVEGNVILVDCTGLECKLLPICNLKGFLEKALIDFYRSLNEFTLKDVINQDQNLKKIFMLSIQ